MIALLFFVGMGLTIYMKWLPPETLAIYLLASLVAFYLYGHDKSAAQKGKWRTPESTLHLADVLGGWPGGLFAQKFFHHKSRKTSFQIVFWLTIFINCVALGCFFYVHQKM
ncbi:MAG: DUF1294 domain-containing protein [Desulfobacteraceae bacterium]|jgi:uncharacterized membrane protein YsdA (DUF1294 family)